MKISELLVKLEYVKAKKGDFEVLIESDGSFNAINSIMFCEGELILCSDGENEEE